jgi:cytochrome c
MRRALLFMLLLLATPAAAELAGHGGPVRAVAPLADGSIVSGSFDTSVIHWNPATGAARAVLRFHTDAVNAAVALPDGGFATAGADARIAIWQPGNPAPVLVLEGHTGPISALAANATHLASASWDRTVRVWPLAGGAPRVLEGHADNVNGVAFLPAPPGQDYRVASAGYDATIRVWRADGTAEITTVPSALNALAAAPDGTLYAAGADGQVHLISGEPIRVGALPLIAIAADATRLAAGGLRGSVSVFARAEARLLFALEGPGLPVWSVAFSADGTRIITGGTDRRVRLWQAATGRHIGAVVPETEDDPAAALAGHPGADVFRACRACHTLTADGANRAGPSLANLFGRRIASLPGYEFSPALRGMDLVWTPETLGRLFEIGPNAYLPGTKMPEQTLGADERAALADFLARFGR